MAAGLKKRPLHLPESEKNTLVAVCSNSTDLEALRNILESERWTVCQAMSFREAAKLIERESPVVVACEHELPDGSWKDLYNFASALNDPPPMVVVSQHADERLWAEVLHLGGYDVLSKPFERTEVSRVMAMASRHGRAAAAR